MRLQPTRLAVVLTATALLAAVAASGAGARGEAAAARVPKACNGLEYGHMGPLTGAAAVLGQEQLKWDRLAVQDFNRAHHTSFRLVEGDDQLNAAQGSTVAQQFASDPKILAVVGPAGSQVVNVAGPIFARVKLAMISESATDGRLSDGQFPTFFRVNANNDSQAPLLSLLITRKLKPKRALVVDDQTPDKTQLADIVTQKLRAKGIQVDRQSVSRDQTDFSSLIGRITSDTGVVLLSWQIASQGQLFAQQLAASGKHPTIVGANGLYSPTQFTPEGAYVSSFAPDVRFVKSASSVVRRYARQYGSFGTYGPPTYVAGQVVMTAMWKICSAGKKPTRAAMLAQIRRTRFKQTILGTPLAFAKNGNNRYAVFFLFQVKNGKYVPATTK
jgi:branched-chain amino acid transport system substrate-binding protein